MVERVRKPNRKKEAFRCAIRNSLEQLERSDDKITKSAVVQNARFENGKSVGKTTIYSRNGKTGEIVHADLLRLIERTADKQIKRKFGRKTKKETITAIRCQLKTLKAENSRLIDQIVEQEARLLEIHCETEGDLNVIKHQEAEIYVLARVASALANGSIKEFNDVVRRFELKYRHESEYLNLADQEVKRYLREAKSASTIGLKPNG